MEGSFSSRIGDGPVVQKCVSSHELLGRPQDTPVANRDKEADELKVCDSSHFLLCSIVDGTSQFPQTSLQHHVAAPGCEPLDGPCHMMSWRILHSDVYCFRALLMAEMFLTCSPRHPTLHPLTQTAAIRCSVSVRAWAHLRCSGLCRLLIPCQQLPLPLPAPTSRT